ncbi:MAG: acyl-CoA dehydrogenase family protein [Mycobacterium sp.]|nr:acyl-CoA dehydrogenase family protein [Mycobacterium sp.]
MRADDRLRQRPQAVWQAALATFKWCSSKLADSVIEINAARWMVYHAAWMLDQGMDAREQIAMVKVHAAETLGRVVDRAVQIFGGMGFCKELPIERYYRDARSLPDF